ncbi:MAG: zinc ribbon domain-containing protein [Clostridia bacterium]|nr:zinc ribbon domain-containing protein [Clostridia bacterium]
MTFQDFSVKKTGFTIIRRMQMKECPSCGATVDEKMAFCPACG